MVTKGDKKRSPDTNQMVTPIRIRNNNAQRQEKASVTGAGMLVSTDFFEDEMMDVQSDHGDQLNQEAGDESLEPNVPRSIGVKTMFTSRGPDAFSKDVLTVVYVAM